MSSAQLGITLAPAIRAGLIHGMSVTGANLEESLFRLVAHDHYKDFPDYRYFTKSDDTKILNDRMRRVTDTSIPEDEAFRAVEKYIVPMWKRASEHGERRFWHEYFYELIQTIGPELHQGPADECWLLAAAQAQAPHRRPRLRGLDLRQHLRVARQARRMRRRRSRSRASSTWAPSTISTASCRRARASASSRSAAASPATSRSASFRRSSTTSSSRPSPGRTSARSPTRPTSYGSYSGATPNEKITWDKLTRRDADVRHRIGRDDRRAARAPRAARVQARPGRRERAHSMRF